MFVGYEVLNIIVEKVPNFIIARGLPNVLILPHLLLVEANELKWFVGIGLDILQNELFIPMHLLSCVFYHSGRLLNALPNKGCVRVLLAKELVLLEEQSLLDFYLQLMG